VYDSALTSQTYVTYINFKPLCKVKVKRNSDISKINTAFIIQPMLKCDAPTVT